MSYLELYNENIRDLLNPSSGFLELREDSGPARSPTVAGLTEIEATSTHEVTKVIQNIFILKSDLRAAKIFKN